MRLFNVLCIVSGCVLISSCGENPSDVVVANGDWGWDNGNGCVDQSDMIRVQEDDIIIFFKDGKRTGEGRSLERKPSSMRGSSGFGGTVKGAEWQILLEGPSADVDLIVHKYNFSYAGPSWGKYLLLNTIDEKKRVRGEWEQKWIRIENKDNPRRGDRLSLCDS